MTALPPSAPPATVQDALHHAARAGLARLDAQILLLHTLGRGPHDRAWLLTHDTDALAPEQAQAYQQACARRLDGEPVAYITGVHEFFGLPLRVDARVLDPRPDTETLVEWALEHLPAHAPAEVLDLGTGSGAIALALAHQRPQARVTAVDASADALAVALANAQTLGLGIQGRHGSWFTPVAGQCFDLVVSNPPYIASADPHLSALRHEPLSALASGPDGLDDLRTIVQAAPNHLHQGGWLLLEHGWDQGDAVATLLTTRGFVNVQSRKDLAGIVRCTGGQWPTLR